jgi:vacuolar-type H+-ATPase subunit C/Vma6
MRPFLADANVRARGLAAHLLSREDLARLARAPSTAALVRELDAIDYPVLDSGGAESLTHGIESLTHGIDAALRRGAGRRLALLALWLGPRATTFAAVFEDEDRRTLRALLRATAQELPTEERLSAVLPTPTLPEPALRRLAESDGIAAMVWDLHRTGNPFGEGLRRALRQYGPNLFFLEVALNRSFAQRSRRVARRAGPEMRAWVAQEIDLENAWTALLGVGSGAAGEARAAQAFLDEGSALSRREYDAVVREESGEERYRALGRLFSRTKLARVFAQPMPAFSTLEARAQATRLGEQRRAARVDPLGPAPLLVFVLALRAEIGNLRRIAWGITLGAPSSALLAELVVA